MTDGSASHPQSVRFSPAGLAALREAEAGEAIRRLGGTPSMLRFLRVADGTVSNLAADARAAVVGAIREIVTDWKPAFVFSPWRRDPHPDHAAVSHIVRDAVRLARVQLRLLEYPVWLAIRGTAEDAPAQTVRRVSFDVDRGAYARKHYALLAHRSQTTQLIDDDPTGFVMSADLIDRFCSLRETFYEDVL
ncbi:MAG: hypothetical protein NVSMB5_05770 [Candidatus Velthaea sp.]